MKDQMRFLVLCLFLTVFSFAVIACDGDDDAKDEDTSSEDIEVKDTDDDDTSDDDTSNEDTSEDDTAEDDTAEDDTAVLTGEFTVSGVVKRVAQLGPNGDGIGTLCIGITHSCPGTMNMNPQSLGDGLTIQDADLSGDDAEAPFSITVDKAEAEMGKFYAVSVVMREQGGDCSPSAPGEPTLLAGDIVAMNCGNFEFEGTDVENIDLTLDWALEWDM